MTTTESHERRLAGAVGARHAIAFGYGRHALIGILRGLGLREGDGVILSPLTCKVVPLAILSAGLRPMWADLSPETLNLDADAAAAAIDARTRAVLFQHTYGHPTGLAQAVALAARHGLPLVEDRAQCMPLTGAVPGVGRGVALVYSNNLLKPLPAGSGGAALTDDAELARSVRRFRDDLPAPTRRERWRLRGESLLHAHVLSPRLYWPLLGLKRRLDPSYRPHTRAEEIADQIIGTARRPSQHQSASGDRWLDNAHEIANHRRRCCVDYALRLRETSCFELPTADAVGPLYYFPVLTERKEAILERARRERVEIVAWPHRTVIYPVEREDQLRVYDYRSGTCPAAERVALRLLGLPTHPGIDDDERTRIVDLLSREAHR